MGTDPVAPSSVNHEIERLGPIPFDRFMELALYAEPGGFFARGAGAGRAARDFVTSPETGPLFGALVARALDREWEALELPDPFVVIEAGAGNGRLAREVLRAQPACASALRLVLVERSAALRRAQLEHLDVEPPGTALTARPGPVVTSLDTFPAIEVEGVLLANELLDNLPFGIAEWDGNAWNEVRVGPGRERVLVPAGDDALAWLDVFVGCPAGATVPIPRGLATWFADAAAALRHGCAILIDYCVTAEQLVARRAGWLRTYRGHDRGPDPLTVEPGSADITADVVLEHVARAAGDAGFDTPSVSTQADWLADLGIAETVEEGRRIWHERAAIGDVVALEARSRATQAAALTDPDGLGAFTVLRLPRARR